MTFTPRMLGTRYRLLDRVGAGVYKAEDLQHGNEIVAIKQIPRTRATGVSGEAMPARVRAIERERRILASLSHPLIPRYLHHFEDDTSWHLVQELIDGVLLTYYGLGLSPLEETLRPPWNLVQVLAIGLQMCEVLSYLHKRQPLVVHRDVKPENALVTPDGRVILVDFECSWMADEEYRRGNLLEGAPGYAAPEQQLAGPPTPLEDIYSLGTTLGCLLCGEQYPQDLALTLQHLAPPAAVLPEDLRLLLLAMVEQDCNLRPPSVDEVGLRLRAILEAHGSSACTPEYVRSLLAHPGLTYTVRGSVE